MPTPIFHYIEHISYFSKEETVRTAAAPPHCFNFLDNDILYNFLIKNKSDD